MSLLGEMVYLNSRRCTAAPHSAGGI